MRFTVVVLALLSLPAASSPAAVTPATPRVLTASHFDISPPLREMVAAAAASRAGELPFLAPGEPGTPPGEWTEAFSPDPVVQNQAGVLSMPSPLQSFNTVPSGGPTPPSVSADVGPGHLVVMSNIRFGIYSKTGTVLLGPANNNTLWAGFGGDCETQNSGNAHVLYDHLADRWIFIQPTYSGTTFAICFAVSTTSDPLGTYYRWSYSLGGNFPDWPQIGLWPDAYYVSTREFMGTGGAFQGAGAMAFNRADLLAGVPSPRVLRFLTPNLPAYLAGDGLLPADFDGTQLPPAGRDPLFVGSMDDGGPHGASQDALTVWRFHSDFATPANSTFTLVATLPVASFDSIYPCPGSARRCIPQPGAATTQFLDILSYRQRLLPRFAYRNYGTHESLVACQSVEAGTGPSGAMSGMRWYELRSPGSTPVVFQQGTYAPGLTDDVHRWMGSVAMDHSGNMAMGFSASNASTVFPAVRYTGRLAGDPSGQMLQGEVSMVSGSGIQTSTSNRWGDYMTLVLDPTDDCTFWCVAEYYPSTSATGWMLRAGSFKFPTCAPAVGVEDDRSQPSGTQIASLGAARGPVEIAFTIGGSETRRVRLEVLDVTGRLVRRLMDETRPGGRYHVTWDRTGDGGDRVRPGVYLLRLVAGNESDSEGVVLLQ